MHLGRRSHGKPYGKLIQPYIIALLVHFFWWHSNTYYAHWMLIKRARRQCFCKARWRKEWGNQEEKTPNDVDGPCQLELVSSSPSPVLSYLDRWLPDQRQINWYNRQCQYLFWGGPEVTLEKFPLRFQVHRLIITSYYFHAFHHHLACEDFESWN